MDIKPKRDADVERFNPKKVYNREDLIAATSLLQIRASEIRQSKINWQAYLQMQVFGQRDFDFLVHLDHRGQKDLPDQTPETCADVFLNLLAHMNTDSALQYVLVLIDDILSEYKSRVKIFRNARHGNVWQPFLKLFYHEDEFVRYMSARIIAKLACWHPQLMEKNDLEHYLSWLKDELTRSNNEYIQSAARCLQMMLRVNEYRFVFLSIDGISTLLSILATRVNFQVQYQLIFCIWAMTFNPVLAEKMNNYNVISVLADILSESVKEKVSRIILAVYRNLIEKTSDPKVSKGHCIAMVQCKVLKQLYILENKSSDDEDFMNDVAFLNERLQASMQDLSSFDQYATELKSGRLEWSPVHKSAKFWRENAARFSEGGQELLRALVQVLDKSRDPVVLAVACFDVGEYVRHYPRGKHYIEQLGGKHRVMFLIGHEDSNVRYEALLAVQKLMVHNWEYLGKQLESEQLDKQTAVAAKA